MVDSRIINGVNSVVNAMPKKVLGKRLVDTTAADMARFINAASKTDTVCLSAETMKNAKGKITGKSLIEFFNSMAKEIGETLQFTKKGKLTAAAKKRTKDDLASMGLPRNASVGEVIKYCFEKFKSI